MFSLQTPIQAQNSQQLFQKGMIQEEGEGNLAKAIDIYNSLVNDVNVDRSIRAKALLHVGICYEKLGNQNARRTYQKLISEYSDQEAIVAEGIEKLNGLKKPENIARDEGIVASQVWSPAQDSYGVSPDGRYLNYIDWGNISLNIKDLKKGTTRVVSKKGTWEVPMEFPDNSIWSPDGKKLAYTWYIDKDTELHIVNMDGSGNKIIAKGQNGTAPWPVSWSRDGKYILALVQDSSKNKKSNKMVLISVNEGSVKLLKDFKNLSCGGYMDISPDNKFIVYSLQEHENSEHKDIYLLSMDGKIDRKLVGDMANDSDPIWSADGKEVFFVSNRYGTNDLWKLKVENGQSVGASEIVKVDLGSQYRLFKVTNDNSIFYGTLNLRNDIYIISMKDFKSTNSYKPLKISEMKNKRNINPIWSSDGQFLAFTRFNSRKDQVYGFKYDLTIYDSQTGNSKNIDTDIYGNIARFKPQWIRDGKELLMNGILKDNNQGGLYNFNINTGKKTPIKVEKDMTWIKMDKVEKFHNYSNDGKSIYYLSKDQKNILKYDINTKRESTILSGTKMLLYFKLSNDNSKIAFGYWYDQHKVLYVISTSGGTKKKIIEEKDCQCSPNVIVWGANDKYLYYKKGEFRDLKKLMRVSIDGGNVEEVLNFEEIFKHGKITGVNMLPNGEHLAVEVEAGKGGEIWKLEGVSNK
jgi:Tol biopolymer transport system component